VKQFNLILITTILGFAALYMPQPILPVLANVFHLTPPEAALFMTLTMLPLGIMPILYGWLLNYFPINKILRFCVLGLALSEFFLASATHVNALLLIRLFQGLLLPGMLTCLVTLAANYSPFESVKKAINLYVATSIIGGFAGRMLSGLLTYLYTWQVSFILLGIALLVFYFLLGDLAEKSTNKSTTLAKGDIGIILSDPINRTSFIFIFLIFFSFASILNFIPFRIVEINGYINEISIASIYFGYLIGSLVAYNCSNIIKLLHGEFNAIKVGIFSIILGLVLFLNDSYLFLFIALSIFCLGFFLLHSVLSALVNHYNQVSSRGVANGLYISCYYFGGALGTYLPGYIYSIFNWTIYIMFIMSIIIIGCFFYFHLKKQFHKLL